MRPILLLCPLLFAVPDQRADVEAVEAFVDRILGFSRLLDERWAELVKPPYMEEVLFGSQTYPMQPALREVFSRCGVQGADVEGVAVAASRLLDRARPSDECFPVKAVVFDRLRLTPDLLANMARPGFREGMTELLVVAALLRGRSSTELMPPVVGTSVSERVDLEVACAVEMVDPDGALGIHASQLPFDLSQPVPICGELEQFILALDETELWCRSARQEYLAVLAIRIASLRHVRLLGRSETWETLPSFVLGREFLERAWACGFGTDRRRVGRLLVACAETVLGENMTAIHELRTGAGGGNPQRIRRKDGAGGWRRDIDSQYHIHYWQAVGEVEFGTVGPHNFYGLPE